MRACDLESGVAMEEESKSVEALPLLLRVKQPELEVAANSNSRAPRSSRRKRMEEELSPGLSKKSKITFYM